MEDIQNPSTATVEEIYQFATSRFAAGKYPYEVKTALIQRGLTEDDATVVVDTLVEQLTKAAKKKKAQKDMLYGALWCIGGTGLTMANIGFIFWGAIVFGGIQFIRGVINSF